MQQPDGDGETGLVIASADEMMRPATRRSFVKMFGLGTSVVLLPSVFGACSDDDPDPVGPGGIPSGGLTFDLRTDIGIFRLVHTLEQLEAAFYTAVVASSNFNGFFTADEREVLVDIRNVEIVHREFVRTALGSQAVPNVTGSINATTLNSLLSSKANILNTARLFEHLGVAGLNGAGKYLQSKANLTLAGKFASVEARHAAALRDILPPTGQNANTSFAGDDIVDGNGRDVKLEAGAVLTKLGSTNLVKAGTLATTPISNGPTAAQGVASADFFPANP